MQEKISFWEKWCFLLQSGKELREEGEGVLADRRRTLFQFSPHHRNSRYGAQALRNRW
jgi:hypothetical protein